MRLAFGLGHEKLLTEYGGQLACTAQLHNSIPCEGDAAPYAAWRRSPVKITHAYLEPITERLFHIVDFSIGNHSQFAKHQAGMRADSFARWVETNACTLLVRTHEDVVICAERRYGSRDEEGLFLMKFYVTTP